MLNCKGMKMSSPTEELLMAIANKLEDFKTGGKGDLEIDRKLWIEFNAIHVLLKLYKMEITFSTVYIPGVSACANGWREDENSAAFKKLDAEAVDLKDRVLNLDWRLYGIVVKADYDKSALHVSFNYVTKARLRRRLNIMFTPKSFTHVFLNDERRQQLDLLLDPSNKEVYLEVTLQL